MVAESENLIDFDVIENSKENIQSLPSGRSAKSLVSVLSPKLLNGGSDIAALKSPPPPSQTEAINNTIRQDFEKEIASIDDSDDPLDVYDRYVKWTLDAYPSAQATPHSQLLPLLERATKSFLSSHHYKNDPRYLRLWLHFTRFFSDAPRETFAFLVRNGVGESLALYYEEFAAWFEKNGRWSQAEEVYKMGMEREARPMERLVRKFGDFERRRDQNTEQGATEPTSPALPTVRPALAAKLDPFAAAAESDPQATSQQASRPAGAKKSKIEIFSDDGSEERPIIGDEPKGWDSIGTIAERKKENVIGAKPWTGETLKSNAPKRAEPKMAIFKDERITNRMKAPASRATDHPPNDQRVLNPRSGRYECVFVNLEEVYSDPENSSVEFCFEELRAAKRGYLQRDWGQGRDQHKRGANENPPIDSDIHVSVASPSAKPQRDGKTNSVPKTTTTTTLKLNDIDEENDENIPPETNAKQQKIDRARRMRREEKANRTKQIKLKEVKNETQTIPTNLSSPQGSRIKRKSSHGRDSTMTMHSKAAQDEMYDLFNHTMKAGDLSEDAAEESEIDETETVGVDEETEEYTSAGESTGTTGPISGTTSDYEEETQGDGEITEAKSADEGEPTSTGTKWTDFDSKKEVRNLLETDVDEEDSAQVEPVNGPSQAVNEYTDEGYSQHHEDELVTPTSPEHVGQDPQTRYVPILPENYVPPRPNPYRNPEQVAQSKLPFMTPIAEKTESSLGAATGTKETCSFGSKTPCPKTSRNDAKTPTIPEADGATENELLSSPFQGMFSNGPRLKDLQISPSKDKTLENGASTAQPGELDRPQNSKPPKLGPLILDKICNPIDPSIRATILENPDQPLSSMRGFFDRTSLSSGRLTEIRKFCKSLKGSNGRSTSGERTSHTLQLPPVLDLEGAERRYSIRRELGTGAYAPVYLVENAEEEDESDEPEMQTKSGDRDSLEALKMEDPPSAWEFYILRIARERLLSSFQATPCASDNDTARAAASLVTAHELHLYSDEGYLIESYRNQGTLLDLVNTCTREPSIGASGAGIDETLAMFFAVELLRTVDALHSVGVIHGDLKADNVLVRLDHELLTAPYSPAGSDGWAAKGISLIDMGRGIDVRAFRDDVGFVADWAAGMTDCAEMREMRPWKWQGDYWGVAGVLHVLLFGKYIDAVAVGGGEAHGLGGRTWKLRESLKRYWQTDVWSELFYLLLNPARAGAESAAEDRPTSEDGKATPSLQQPLRRVTARMQDFLGRHGERGVGLRAQVRRLEVLLAQRRC